MRVPSAAFRISNEHKGWNLSISEISDGQPAISGLALSHALSQREFPCSYQMPIMMNFISIYFAVKSTNVLKSKVSSNISSRIVSFTY